MLKGKLIILGVTGGIAAYKACEIVRRLIKLGADVKVVMTKNAAEFITPLTLQTLSKNPVICDMFAPYQREEIEHISLSDELDLLLVAPATANIIGKFANGVADDFLSTLFLSVTKPVVVTPAMNEKMYAHKVVKENFEKLRTMGVEIVEPGYGELACDTVGYGRLADEDVIVSKVEEILKKKQDLHHKTILITAGPTQEPIDPIRFLSNPSSGKMGHALAKEARKRGADVILVEGPTNLSPPLGIKSVSVQTAKQMRDAAMKHYQDVDVVIKAAAVSDFRPKRTASRKVKKEKDDLNLELVRTPDILEEMGLKKKDQILIGFAAETGDLVKNAREKIKKKNLDLIVANDVSRKDTGFKSDSNKAVIIYKNGRTKELPVMTKELLAKEILDCALSLLTRRRK